MKKACAIIAAFLLALAPAGCHSRTAPGADQAMEKPEEHLLEVDLIKQGLKGDAGEKLVRETGEIKEIRIDGNDCYAVILSFADEPGNGVMAGRRYAVFGASKDGLHFYRENTAADTGEETWDEI